MTDPIASEGRETTPSPQRIALIDVAGWLTVAWVAYWSVAYVRSAIFPRFPRLAEWIGGLFS